MGLTLGSFPISERASSVFLPARICSSMWEISDSVNIFTFSLVGFGLVFRWEEIMTIETLLYFLMTGSSVMLLFILTNFEKLLGMPRLRAFKLPDLPRVFALIAKREPEEKRERMNEFLANQELARKAA